MMALIRPQLGPSGLVLVPVEWAAGGPAAALCMRPGAGHLVALPYPGHHAGALAVDAGLHQLYGLRGVADQHCQLARLQAHYALSPPRGAGVLCRRLFTDGW